MFLLKGCPRCGGDLSLGLDGEVSCLQCGHELNVSAEALQAGISKAMARRTQRVTASTSRLVTGSPYRAA